MPARPQSTVAISRSPGARSAGVRRALLIVLLLNALGLLIASLVVNGFVVVYERRGRVLGSSLLLADAAHTASDILRDSIPILVDARAVDPERPTSIVRRSRG